MLVKRVSYKITLLCYNKITTKQPKNKHIVATYPHQKNKLFTFPAITTQTLTKH